MSTAVVPTRETFCRQLGTMQRGQFDDEVTAAVRELVREMTQVAEQGNSKPKAKVVISVEFSLDRGMMDVVADFAVKHPKKVRGRTILYPSATGQLLPHDPQQGSLDLTSARDAAVDGARNVRVVG